MPKVATNRHNEKGLDFKYDISVDSQGIFSTTLPAEIVKELDKVGVTTLANRLGNKGYFYSTTLEGVTKEVARVCNIYTSEEEVQRKIVIKYGVHIYCSYAINAEGKCFPNCSEDFDPTAVWAKGTADMSATYPKPFGYLLYVRPFLKITKKRNDGSVKDYYERLSNNDFDWKTHKNLLWLNSVTSIGSGDYSMTIEELDYDEDTAEYFVNALKSIILFNENLKQHLKPDQLKELIYKNRQIGGPE